MSEEKVIVNLQVAGRNLPLDVPVEEADLVRNAGALLDDKLQGLSGTQMNLEQRLLLVALELAGDSLKAERARQQLIDEQKEGPALSGQTQQQLRQLVVELNLATGSGSARATPAEPPASPDGAYYRVQQKPDEAAAEQAQATPPDEDATEDYRHPPSEYDQTQEAGEHDFPTEAENSSD